MGVGGVDDRHTATVEHLKEGAVGVDLANWLAQARRVHVYDYSRLRHGVGGLLEHVRYIPLWKVAEDLDEVRVAEDVEASREGGLADVPVVRPVEVVGVPLIVEEIGR